MDSNSHNEKVRGSLQGVVQSLELRSGMNPLLFLDAIFGIPGISVYGITGRKEVFWLLCLLVVATLLFYGAAFIKDRSFLRSEKHVYDMRRLDILGEKGKEISEVELLTIAPTADPTTPAIKGGR